MDINVGDDILSLCDQKNPLSMGTGLNGYGAMVVFSFHKCFPVNRVKLVGSYLLHFHACLT
jgi:hypothetical protein